MHSLRSQRKAMSTLNQPDTSYGRFPTAMTQPTTSVICSGLLRQELVDTTRRPPGVKRRRLPVSSDLPWSGRRSRAGTLVRVTVSVRVTAGRNPPARRNLAVRLQRLAGVRPLDPRSDVSGCGPERVAGRTDRRRGEHPASFGAARGASQRRAGVAVIAPDLEATAGRAGVFVRRHATRPVTRPAGGCLDRRSTGGR
jgi:hypothetical protein